MEIHELNTFSGTLGSSDFFATDNGNDTSKVSAEAMFAPLNARIDNIIAGPAPSAEEIVDARRGADGVTYPSLGDAIRTQVTDLKSDLGDVESLFETELIEVTPTATVGYRWSKVDGSLVEHSAATAWECVAEEFTDYWIHGISTGNSTFPILFINSNDEIISYIDDAVQSSGFKVLVRTPSGCVKIRYTSQTNATWDAPPEKIVLKSLQEQPPIKQNTQKIATLNADVAELKLDVTGEYPLEWVANEYVVTSDGSFAHYNGWKRTDYVDVDGAKKIIITNSGSPNNNNVWYDENKNWVAWFRNGSGTLVVPSTAKYFAISAESSAEFTITKGDAEDDERISNLEAEYMPNIPTYYEAHVASKINEIQSLEANGAMTGDCFVFVTDQHYPKNTGNSPALIQKIMRETGTRFVVSGGDVNNNANGVPAMKTVVHDYINQIKQVFPMLNIVGNHEWYTNVIDTSKARPTESDLYATMQKYAESDYVDIGALNSFVVDNTIQKIRYIFVSCDFDTNTTTAQKEWFLNELLNVPNGYTLVVIGHAFLTDSMVAIRSSHTDFCNGLDALKTKTTYSFNGNTYDYSSKDVNVACIITGHTHIDGTLLTSGGVRIICTTTDSAELNYELVNGTPTLSARTQGTVNEQAFDVFFINTSARTINTIRVGYGSNRNYSY